MNWVGGSRSRYISKKDDTLKLKAFFQKQRMKKKSDNIDFTKEQNSGNMDMLSLFIVNQMASKKEQTDKPKINNFIGAKTTKKAWNEPLRFPMSPCPPSNLNLVSSQPKYSVGTPGFKARKYRLHERFKPLSPVFESNLSNASGSENQEQPSSFFFDAIQATPSTESLDDMKNYPQLAGEWIDASGDVSMQDMPAVGLQSETVLPMREMSERSAASVMFPESNLKSSKQLEEPQFIDFTNIDCEVLASLNSCNSSQKMENESQFSMQKCAFTDSNTCADGGFMHVSESSRGGPLNVDDTEAQRHDGNPPITLDTGTQTAALSYCDVSVQCSLIQHSHSLSIPTAHQKFSILTTRRQSFIFNQRNVTTLGSLKNGHKSAGNMPLGASATNQVAQKYPKLQTAVSFLKLRQMRMKRDWTSDLKPSFPQSLSRAEQRRVVGKQSENREVCDPHSQSLTQNPVNDVRHEGEPMKEMKIRKV